MKKRLKPEIDELSKKTISDAVISRQRLIEMVSERTKVAFESGDDGVFLKSAETLAKLAGYNAPQEVKQTVSGSISQHTTEELLLIAGVKMDDGQ